MGSDIQRSDSAMQPLLFAAHAMTPVQVAIFQHCLQVAANGGQALFESLLIDARQMAEIRANDYWGTAKAEAMSEGPTLLNRYAPILAEAFGAALTQAFLSSISDATRSTETVKAPSLSNLRFDQLELVDNEQVHGNVESSRVEQAAKVEAELPLTELNALICAVQGLPFVQLERNPLRPASYVAALQSVFQQADATESVRMDWLQLMGVGLGKELCSIYAQLCEMLRAAEVSPADYNVIPSAPASLSPTFSSYNEFNSSQLGHGVTGRRSGIGDGGGTSTRQGGYRSEDGLRGSEGSKIKLTIEQLRRLIAGDFIIDDEIEDELDASPNGAGGSTGRDFSSSEFDQTMPAALEALQEMQQVDEAIARLAERLTSPRSGISGGRAGTLERSRRHSEPALGAIPLAELQGDRLLDRLCQQAHSVSQVLGLEAVSLMVEHAASDPRLLPPIQAIVRTLASPLLRLVMVDSRFLNDTAHPARQLLEAIVAQGLRFTELESTLFKAFIQPLKRIIDELPHVPITDAEPFKLSLAKLNHIWDAKSQSDASAGEPTADSSWVGEARMKSLAKKIASEINGRADAAMVPVPVLEFATGPWSLAMAHAQLLAPAVGDRVDDQGLLDDLFWSARPVLAGTDPERLIKLIPGMLTRLRAGLRIIGYPKAAMGEFFEILMALHQKALTDKSSAKDASVSTVSGELTADMESPPVTTKAVTPKTAAPKAHQSWETSNETMSPTFLDHFDFPDLIDAQTTEPMAFSGAGVTSVMATVSVSNLPVDATATQIEVGSWVEMTIGGDTMRAQLVWCSPEGANFMFTTSTGRNQAMTRRSVDALIQRGMIKLLQSRGVPGNAASVSAVMVQPSGLNNRGL